MRLQGADGTLVISDIDDTIKVSSATDTEKEPALAIGDLLGAELSRRGVTPAAFSPAEAEGFRAKAMDSIAELAKSRAQLRSDILARPGTRVIIEVPEGAGPFRVERFDPINLSILDRGEVVHANYLTLRGENGSIEVANPGFVRRSFAGTVSLTVSGGRHPITGGVRRITVLGIPAPPRITREDGAVKVDAPELRASLAGADVQVDVPTIRIADSEHPESTPIVRAAASISAGQADRPSASRSREA